ncbi:MAG: hypothetical protein LiPW41_736 [Parcubacteria group bacterium LiPW_41]|nr:MAG: hypothetical protein LiPW41_736 [Parcubacteria group bacterium LiPW_41]
MTVQGLSLGGMGPHIFVERDSLHVYGLGSSIEERCFVKALVAGASPVQDP